MHDNVINCTLYLNYQQHCISSSPPPNDEESLTVSEIKDPVIAMLKRNRQKIITSSSSSYINSNIECVIKENMKLNVVLHLLKHFSLHVLFAKYNRLLHFQQDTTSYN